MTPLILAHGWGLDRTYWDPLLPHLGDQEIITLDFGYYGNPHLPPLPEGSLVIGHSLGVLWALEKVPAIKGLISLNGFSKFTRDDIFDKGHPPRPLERMGKKMERAPEVVLQDFAQLYGLNLPSLKAPHIPALQTGLELLKRGDGRQTLEATPHRSLAASHDPMVPRAMTEALFKNPLFFEGASHDLLHTHGDACVEKISEILDTFGEKNRQP